MLKDGKLFEKFILDLSTIIRRKIVRDKFLGCMKSLQVGFETVNLWEGKATVGVTEGCKESVSHFMVQSC